VPTVLDPTLALALLERYGVRDRVPPTVIETLEVRRVGEETTAYPITIVGDNDVALDAAAAASRADGYRTEIIWRKRRGEAADLARRWVDACEGADPAIDVLLGGGEATVTVRGDGAGGRNTEFALAAALALAERAPTWPATHGWVVASLATDGQDALTGVAGAIADAGSVARARSRHVDPQTALARNDSLRVFEAAGGLVRPGPTGTNVCDLYFALRPERVA
jgi:hydroxypyruvate reductase